MWTVIYWVFYLKASSGNTDLTSNFDNLVFDSIHIATFENDENVEDDLLLLFLSNCRYSSV